MNRIEPDCAYFYNWLDFNIWADDNGIGVSTDDWLPWWNCWVEAFKSAMDS
jgi:hypothetical protein